MTSVIALSFRWPNKGRNSYQWKVCWVSAAKEMDWMFHIFCVFVKGLLYRLVTLYPNIFNSKLAFVRRIQIWMSAVLFCKLNSKFGKFEPFFAWFCLFRWSLTHLKCPVLTFIKSLIANGTPQRVLQQRREKQGHTQASRPCPVAIHASGCLFSGCPEPFWQGEVLTQRKQHGRCLQ